MIAAMHRGKAFLKMAQWPKIGMPKCTYTAQWAKKIETPMAENPNWFSALSLSLFLLPDLVTTQRPMLAMLIRKSSAYFAHLR